MTAIVVGGFRSDESEPIERAIERGRASTLFRSTVEEAIEELKNEESKVALVFVRTGTPRFAQFVSWLREQARLFAVPIVAIANNASDHEFAEAHAFGADDVVLVSDVGGFTRRAASLESYDPSHRPPVVEGRAIVGHPDRARRLLLGRGLRQAGFDVAFAETSAELLEIARSGTAPRLVVADGALDEGSDLGLVNTVRDALSDSTPMVLIEEPGFRRSLIPKSLALGLVELTPADAPPDNLVFLANELLRPEHQRVRSSTRLLYGTLASFRPAGEMRPVFGFVYNMSREGISIRSLDPCAKGESVWLELMPPASVRAVHLRVTVVASRAFSSGAGGGEPAGFAVRIDEAACPADDLRVYREGYEQLLAEKRGSA